MTKSERREVAATLREWAAWCEKHPGASWLSAFINSSLVTSAGNTCAIFNAQFPAQRWCRTRNTLYGTNAALALCFAAAMVESGDDL